MSDSVSMTNLNNMKANGIEEALFAIPHYMITSDRDGKCVLISDLKKRIEQLRSGKE